MGLHNLLAIRSPVDEMEESEIRQDIAYFKARLDYLQNQASNEKRGHAMKLVYQTLLQHREKQLAKVAGYQEWEHQAFAK